MSNDIAAVRLRPAMYVGGTEARGLHHLLWELVANSLDELLAGFGTAIDVVLHADGSASVADDGRGFSVDLDKDKDGSAHVEACLTQLHTTPTRDGHRPHVHVSLRGVGLPVVAALSEKLSIESERQGRRWRFAMLRGEISEGFEEVDRTGSSGTTVRIKPDASIFSEVAFDCEMVCERLSEIAALSDSVRFLFRDERQGVELRIEHPEGLEALLSPSSDDAEPVLRISAPLPEGNLDAILRWRKHGELAIRSYAQLRETDGGGSHVRGFLRGLVQGAHWVDKRAGSRAATREALFDGAEIVLHVTMFASPKYGGPTKDRIDDPKLEAVVYDTVKAAARDIFASDTALLAAVLARSPTSA